MSVQPERRYTLDEYLALEQSTHEKHEYFQGEIFDYLLVAQDRALVEHYCRQPGDLWLLHAANRLTDSITIASLGCTLALSEVYLNVEGIAAA